MPFKITEVVVTEYQIEQHGTYVPGTRLEVTFEDGEVAYFREVYNNTGFEGYVQIILDDKLSSKIILEDLYGRREPREPSASQLSLPTLQEGLGIDGLPYDAREYIVIDLSESIRRSHTATEHELEGWVHRYGSGGGYGISIYSGYAVKSIKLVVLPDTP